jgi:hypothetical protein
MDDARRDDTSNIGDLLVEGLSGLIGVGNTQLIAGSEVRLLATESMGPQSSFFALISGAEDIADAELRVVERRLQILNGVGQLTAYGGRIMCSIV